MKITKYGHSCLYIEEGSARILIDPGNYVFKDSLVKPEDLPECNVLLLTHEHPDHTYPEALKIILKNKHSENGAIAPISELVILTNTAVRKVLEQNGITGSAVLGRGEERIVHGVTIRGIACDHGHIADHIPHCENVGFFIGERLLHPGDCVAPSEEVHAEILAVPVVAPWMAVREGLEFVKKLKPKFAIPIHDAILRWPEMPWYMIFQTGLKDTGIEFVPLKIGEAREF